MSAQCDCGLCERCAQAMQRAEAVVVAARQLARDAAAARGLAPSRRRDADVASAALMHLGEGELTTVDVAVDLRVIERAVGVELPLWRSPRRPVARPPANDPAEPVSGDELRRRTLARARDLYRERRARAGAVLSDVELDAEISGYDERAEIAAHDRFASQEASATRLLSSFRRKARAWIGGKTEDDGLATAGVIAIANMDYTAASTGIVGGTRPSIARFASRLVEEEPGLTPRDLAVLALVAGHWPASVSRSALKRPDDVIAAVAQAVRIAQKDAKRREK